MRLSALPSIVFAWILYNLVVFAGPADVLNFQVWHMPLPSTADWKFTVGDLLIIITMALLFVELLKSATSSASSLVDHALSLVIFIFCLLEFVLVKHAGTSVFVIIMMACLIDVIAGYSIGFQTARRNLNIGNNN